MPTEEKILDKVISVLRTWDNDVYTTDQMRNKKDVLLVGADGLGLGSTRCRYAATQLNEYIITNGGEPAVVTKLVKTSDTVSDVVKKTKKAINKTS